MTEEKSSKFRIKPASVVLLILGFIGIYFLLPQLGNFDETLTVLRHASWLWVLFAALVFEVSFVVAAIGQFAAGNSIGKFSDIVWLQFAGSFMNHFLPFSLGGTGMTEEYYHKQGQPRSKALVYVTIPIIFGVITTIALIIILSPITLVQLGHSLQGNPRTRLVVKVVGLIAILATLLVVLVAKFHREWFMGWYKKITTEVAAGLKGIRSLKQMAIVIISSLGITLLSALALYSSVKAVHASITVVAVLVLYITSSLVSNVAPTPGGLGATEATLIFGLSRAGLSLHQAVAATIIYRFVEFWLPLLPGIIALRQVRIKKLVSIT